MSKFYKINLSNDHIVTELTYSINKSIVSQQWANMMTKVSPNDIRPYSSPWRGIIKDWDAKVHELKELITSLNSWLPEKIDGEWNDKYPDSSLNKLHVHFPDLKILLMGFPDSKKNKENINRTIQLSRFNDLIHEMQSMSNAKKNSKESMQLIICPENKDIDHIDIPLKCFKEFTHKINFGDLMLHYCHIGRHPFEVFVSNDNDVPSDQLIPQKSIYSYHSLRFFDIDFDRRFFEEFYKNSKISWPYKLNDPRLAFGYIKMGKLELVNGKPWERETVFNLVRNSNSIQSWEIF